MVALVDVTVDGNFTDAEYQAATSLLASLSDLWNSISLLVSTCSTHHSFPRILFLDPILDAQTIFFPHYQLPFSSDNSSFHWSALPSSFPKLSFSTISFISFHFKVSSLPTITFLLCSSHQTLGASRLHLESSTTFAISQYSSKFNTWNTSDIL